MKIVCRPPKCALVPAALCITANLTAQCPFRVNHVALGAQADVRSSPNCDRNSDLPGGR